MKYVYLLLLSFFIISSCQDNDIAQEDQDKNKKADQNLVAMVMQDNLYGYINTNGQFIIKPQYKLARTFSNNKACINQGGVRDKSGMINGVLGGIYSFIDINNKPVLNGFTMEDPASFYNDVLIIINKNGKRDLVDSNGETLLSNYDMIGKMENGLMPAVKQGEKKLGYIDASGQWKIKLPFKYFIGSYSDKLAVITDGKTKLNGYIDMKGSIVVAPKFKKANDFHLGRAAVLNDKKYYFVNKKGRIAFSGQFDKTSNFKEGLCAVLQNGKWGFIDTSGNVVIDYRFRNVRNFCEGLAAVMENGRVGFINKKGEYIITPTFDNALSFNKGYAIIEKGNKMGFINKQGDIIIAPQFQRAGNFVDPSETNRIFREN